MMFCNFMKNLGRVMVIRVIFITDQNGVPHDQALSLTFPQLGEGGDDPIWQWPIQFSPTLELFSLLVVVN